MTKKFSQYRVWAELSDIGLITDEFDPNRYYGEIEVREKPRKTKKTPNAKAKKTTKATTDKKEGEGV